MQRNVLSVCGSNTQMSPYLFLFADESGSVASTFDVGSARIICLDSPASLVTRSYLASVVLAYASRFFLRNCAYVTDGLGGSSSRMSMESSVETKGNEWNHFVIELMSEIVKPFGKRLKSSKPMAKGRSMSIFSTFGFGKWSLTSFDKDSISFLILRGSYS